MKKAGVILLLAGLTLGVASLAAPPNLSRPLGITGIAVAVVGAVALVVGMIRSGPRDEELPTAEARPERRR